MNILLIDDHILFAKSLEIAFEDYPEVSTFLSVQEVAHLMKMIEVKRPDILLLDINLSNISEEDGLIIADTVSKKYPDLNIVILTGFDLPVYRYEAKKRVHVDLSTKMYLLISCYISCFIFMQVVRIFQMKKTRLSNSPSRRPKFCKCYAMGTKEKK